MDDSDDSWDDLSWAPDLKELYDDDSWVTKETKIDPERDYNILKVLTAKEINCHPKMFVELLDINEKKVVFPTVECARKSSLSLTEMSKYLRLEKHYKRTQSISVLKRDKYAEYTEFKSLQSKVLVEQEEYQKFLLESAMASVPKYNYVDEEAEKWVKICMNVVKEDLKRYKRYYVHLKDFGIVFVPFKNDSLPSSVQNLVKTFGNVKVLHSVTPATQIPRQINYRQKQKTKDENPGTWHKSPISEDANAKKLAIVWRADIVISLGSLQTLADNHKPYQNEWEIPVIVETFQSLGNSTSQKVAFIDKKLPPKRIEPQEKNLRYFKEVNKWLHEIPNAWGKVHGVMKKHNDLSSNNCAMSDVIMQVDGANDEAPLFEPRVKNVVDVIENFGSESFLCQVDGANDDATSKKKPHTAGRISKSSVADGDTVKSSVKMWSQSKRLSSFKEQNRTTGFGDWLSSSTINKSLSSGDSKPAEFQPFIGHKSLSSFHPMQTRRDSQEKSEDSKEDDDDDDRDSPKEELSFGLLPDSAITFNQDGDGEPKSSKVRTKRASKSKKQSEDEVIFSFTPRRSKRIKSGDDKNQSVGLSSTESKSLKQNKSGSAKNRPDVSSTDFSKTFSIFATSSVNVLEKNVLTSTPVLDTRRKKKGLVIESDSESDNDTLSVVKKRSKNAKGSGPLMVQTDNHELPGEAEKKSMPSKNPNMLKMTTLKPLETEAIDASSSNDVLSQILPTDFKIKAQSEKDSEKLATLTPFKPTNDLVGQIMGGKPKSTCKDVRSAWISDAKNMSQADSDNEFPSDDLNLQHILRKDTNVTYALWKFGKKRVLIRYTVHGKMRPPDEPNSSNLGPVILRTKLEYQSDLAYEQLTMSEVSRDWVSMLIKRFSKVARMRCDPMKGTILDVDWTKSMNHLNDKAEKIGYNPAVTSKMLIRIFDMLSGLEKGEYICCHRANESKLVVRKAVNDIGKKVIYDLQKEYSSPGRDVFYTQSVPWIPGDPDKPTVKHVEKKVIPLTFNPKSDDGNAQAKNAKRTTKKKKKQAKKQETDLDSG